MSRSVERSEQKIRYHGSLSLAHSRDVDDNDPDDDYEDDDVNDDDDDKNLENHEDDDDDDVVGAACMIWKEFPGKKIVETWKKIKFQAGKEKN